MDLIPKDKTLPWAPTRFAGVFTHGNLNGLTFISTNASSSYGWLSVKDDVLHGPCVFFGIQPLLPVREIFQYLILDFKCFVKHNIIHGVSKKVILVCKIGGYLRSMSHVNQPSVSMSMSGSANPLEEVST